MKENNITKKDNPAAGSTTLDNIKMLNTSSADINNLLSSIRSAKKQIDGISRSIKTKETNFLEERAKKEAAALAAEEAKKNPPKVEEPQKPEPALKPAEPKQERPPYRAPEARPATDENRIRHYDTRNDTSYKGGADRRDGTQRPPYQGQQGTRPPYQGQGQGQRPPYQQGQRPPYQQGQGQRPPYQGQQGTRPPYQGQGQGQRPPYQQGQRPPFGQGGTSSFRPAGGLLPPPQPGKVFGANKKKGGEFAGKSYDDKKNTTSKRALIERSLNPMDEEEGGIRRYKVKKQKAAHVFTPIVITEAVVNTPDIPIKTLAEKIGVPATEIIKKLFKEGIVKTINDTVDYEYAAYLASELRINLVYKPDKTFEEVLKESVDSKVEVDSNLKKRPPVVTVMGHVDHGKTSLLDAIRKSNVTTGEAGGITQHIGAYTVSLNKELITFIDTPGHEAFTAMRARGAKATDIAILVVAADDGVMPQTAEAISHIKAAKVPMIVAVNKIDKPTADVERIKQQLTEYEIVPEEWGGDAVIVPVSAKANKNIDKLLEAILLVAEMNDLKANPDTNAKGIVLEAKLDKGMGPVATVLVQNGTLKSGDTIIAGTVTGKLRALFDDKGKPVKQAGPSHAVSVLGLSDVPNAGDFFYVVDEKLSKQLAEERKNKTAADRMQIAAKVTLDDMFSKISEGQIKNLNVIIKADVQGSMEALKVSLIKISNEEVKINPIHGGVGAITETDVMLGKASNAIIIGFNTKPDAKAKQLAERDGVDIRSYRVIYEAIDEITAAAKGMMKPVYEEHAMGKAEVRQLFKFDNTAIAGCMVTDGKIVRHAKARLVRDGEQIYEGSVDTLRRFKDDVKEVAAGYECGMVLSGNNNLKEGDIIEVYQVVEKKA